MNAYVNMPADPYGYQNIAGPNNDGYSPYIAADGTNLSGVSATGQYNCAQLAAVGYDLVPLSKVNWTKWRYTIVGEFHSNWDATATFKYEDAAASRLPGGIRSPGGDGRTWVNPC